MDVFIFCGLSIDIDSAKKIVPSATFRPPIRRGDLDSIAAGSVVGIIDGVFDHNFAITPQEVNSLVARGVAVFGSSSMGALRAAECRGVRAIGKIADWYTRGVITDDADVAVAFDPDTLQPISVPQVNVRYALQRLESSGTLSKEWASKFLKTSEALYYPERTYMRILVESGMKSKDEQTRALASMLNAIDLKKEDAFSLLEAVAAYLDSGEKPQVPEGPLESTSLEYQDELAVEVGEIPDRDDPKSDVFLWEFGENVKFDQLVEFLAMSGKLGHFATRVASRGLVAGWLSPTDAQRATLDKPRAEDIPFLNWVAAEWGWYHEDDVAVMMRECGLGLDAMHQALREHTLVLQVAQEAIRSRNTRFLSALRHELFLNNMTLKREAARAGTLQKFVQPNGDGDLESLDKIKAILTLQNGCADWKDACRIWELWGVSAQAAEQVAQAVQRMRQAAQEEWSRPAIELKHETLVSRMKLPDNLEFSISATDAMDALQPLRERFGITKLASIHRLTNIDVPIVQCFRPNKPWSSTLASGKATTEIGASVGAIMEDCETIAQELYDDRSEEGPFASYEEFSKDHECIDPTHLPLSFDSLYDPKKRINWTQTRDVLQERDVWIPSAFVTTHRLQNDPLYSPRRGGKIHSTNGLGAGFSLEEAFHHALCEYIERHNIIMNQTIYSNPGVWGAPARTIIDHDTLNDENRKIIAEVEKNGARIRLMDVRTDIRVPTFVGLVCEDDVEDTETRVRGVLSYGSGAHPNAHIAARRALLECVQTIMGNVSSAREDIAVKTRSLGRHERMRPRPPFFELQWQTGFDRTLSMADIEGLSDRDVLNEISWMMERLLQAGVRNVIMHDLSCEDMSPVRVVRTFVPRLEDPTVTFRTGQRARLALFEDLISLPAGVGALPANMATTLTHHDYPAELL